jgi:hypothetical protein
VEDLKKHNGPHVLFLDIETSLMRVLTFGIWEQTIRPDDIEEDWTVISWAASWLGDKEVMFMGNMKEKRLLKGMWELLNKADIIVTQNGKAFDIKRLMARFLIHDFKPYSPVEHADTKQMAKKFGLTSHSLEYMCKVLKTKHQKLKHGKFPGKELWKECAAGNSEAWAEMELYNKHDVLCLKDVYEKLRVWGDPVSFNPYTSDNAYVCNCGSTIFTKRGFNRRKSGTFQRFQCSGCNSWHQSSGASNNLMPAAKRASLKKPGG